MELIRKVYKINSSSLVIVIPKDIVKKLDIKASDKLSIDCIDNKIIYTLVK